MAELPKSKMSELSQKDISKKLDDKVALKNISDVLGNMIITTKQFGDKLRKKDKLKASQGLRMGGRASLKIGGPGQQIRRKKKKNIEDVVDDTAVDNIFAGFNRRLKKAEKQYEDIPSGMKKDPKNRAEIQAKLASKALKDRKPFEEFKKTRREVFATQRMAKGGRAGYKSGSKGCKLAMKGKGRAYGKNS